MVYRRRMRRSRRSRRPGRWGIYKAAGKQLWRDVKMLKSFVNTEKKYSDYTFSSTVSTTHNFQLVNGLTIGSSGITREGQSIKMYSLLGRFYMTMNATATTTQIRIIILKDRQANAAVPTSGNLLQDNTNFLSPLSISNSKRYRVYTDKVFRLDTNKLNQEFKKFMKLRFHVEYNTGNAGTIADITTNSLYVMLLSDQATNTPTVSFWVRIRFIDN